VADVPGIADWFDAGERVAVELDGGRFEVFTRAIGNQDAPCLTFLHGFPTCSWDWVDVVDALGTGRRVVLFDFLGFGDSDKPRSHRYSINEQADLTEAVWRRFGVERNDLVAHDYGVSVAQELLARQQEGRGKAEVTSVGFLNGGLYAHLHRPLRVQRLLRKPVLGSLVGRLIDEGRFRQSFCEVFAPATRPSDDELHQHWLGVSRREGHRIHHRLIRYMDDRRRHHERWEGALEQTSAPLCFVWGMVDPVSGAHVAEHLRERVPDSRLECLEEVGHYPQLEAPQAVTSALREHLERV
jgi:pimeloyl-ACP methyl ester carboxylesterase